jgi:sensor histidine kinase YesM
MMRKIIILAVIVLIPFFIAIDGDSTKTLKDKVEKEGYVINPKDSLWEFVKNEFKYNRIDLNIKYQKTYQEPILFSLKNATKRDSLLVEKMMDKLKFIFPNKRIQYFRDFTGEKYIPFSDDKWLSSFKETSDELYSYNNLIVFDNSIKSGGELITSFDLNDRTGLKFGKRKNRWNSYVIENEIKVAIDEKISEIESISFITYFFLESYWKIKNTKPENANPDFRTVKLNYGGYRKNYKKRAKSLFFNDYKFLFQKLFSTNFKEQLTGYMYKTYPWQYTRIFIDKDKVRKNTNTLVIVLGMLLLIFSTTFFWNKKKELTFYDYFFCVFVFFVGLTSLSILHSYLFQIDALNPSIFESVVFLSCSILISLLISFSVLQIEKQINQKINQFGFRLFLKTICTFFALYLPYFLFFLFKDFVLDSESTTIKPVTDLQFLFLVIGLTFTRISIIYLNDYAASQLRQKDLEISNLKTLQAQSETKLLQSQINPHFLYNSLNSIASLALVDASKTQQMAYSLSDLFKYSINRKGKKMGLIKDEIEMVESYLSIEKIRFGERLKYEIQVDETLMEEEIPLFLLQPLVENAVKHGVSKNTESGEIVLKIEKENNTIIITVADNGPDFPEGLVSGHGLQTVFDLLRLSYGDKAKLNWTNTPEKQIVISIPK